MAEFNQQPTQPSLSDEVQPAVQPHSEVPQPAMASLPQSDRHHVHHSYIWLGSIQVAGAIFVVMIFSFFSSIMGALAEGEGLGRGDGLSLVAIGGFCLLGFVLIMAIVALAQWWSYRHLYYELGPNEFNLYSGIFNKKRVHVPYQRIQSVDQRTKLIQRIFGVCSVSIDTAGGSANKAVTVPYVQKAQAEELRRELFARKQYVVAVHEGTAPAVAAQAAAAAAGVMLPYAGQSDPGQYAPHNVLDAPAEIWQDVRGVFGGENIDTGRVTYEYGMTNKELILTGLSNNTAFLVIILGIFGAIAQFAGEIAPILAGRMDPMVGNVVGVSVQLFGGNMIAAGVAAFLAGAVILWVASAIGACISYGGFRACRRDSRIEVEHGLLQHQFQGVDVSRVQSVVVKQSFIRRLMGYCEVSVGKIDAAAEGSEDQQKSLSQQGVVIHPFVKMNRVPEILAGLIPEFADVPIDNVPVAPVGLRRAIIRRSLIQGTGFWLAVVVAIVQVCFNAFMPPASENATLLYYVNMGSFVGYALCFVLLILDIVGAVLWFRGSGFAYNSHFMQVSNGGFARETISFPRKKIQFAYTRTNPFQRHARTATINARTAAGIGGTTVRLIDARCDDAQAWLEWLKPQGSVIK